VWILIKVEFKQFWDVLLRQIQKLAVVLREEMFAKHRRHDGREQGTSVDDIS
jgi:hypothetical protein